MNLYKDDHGRKSFASGAVKTDRGRSDYHMVKRDDVILKRSWGEVSGKVADILIGYGATKIPAKYAHELLGDDSIKPHEDGYHYTRLINSIPYTKILVGYPNFENLIKSNPELKKVLTSQ